MLPRRRDVLKSTGALVAAGAIPTPIFAQGREKAITISTTGILTSYNPYAHSSAHLYSIWGQVYGTLGRYNYDTNKFEGVLAESWTAVEPMRWRFKLRSGLKRHDGGPGPTSRDVIHSWQRILNDPTSRQRHRFNQVTKIEALDDLTFDIVTNAPFAQLPSLILFRLSVTSAELHEKHGAKDVDKAAPFGWGPYKLDRLNIDDRVVLRRNPDWPDLSPDAPDVAIYRQIFEPEQRVTALLNNEVQIARLIPPQLLDRLKGRREVKVQETGSLEFMFLGMNLKFKPWDDVRVRRAVAHAVNRDLIIDRLLFGLADRMDGAISKFQDCYAPPKTTFTYDPKRARALLAEAGYPNGVEVDFYTAVGRYVSDRQVAEVVTQMLGQAGFKVKLHTPEYAAFTAEIDAGKIPFYYTGRAGSEEALDALPQFFETGGSKRINYSDSEVDALFAKVRATFDEPEQCHLKQAISDKLAADVPAVFMWTHKLIQGVRANVSWEADPNGEIWLPDVRIR